MKFDSLLLKDAVVEADCIIPPLREEDPLSSDSDMEDSGDGDTEGYAKGMQKLLENKKKKWCFLNQDKVKT